jgi:hypothetical protein
LKTNIEPQLSERDLKTFRHYTGLVFPGVEFVAMENNDLKESLIAHFKSSNLEVCKVNKLFAQISRSALAIGIPN